MNKSFLPPGSFVVLKKYTSANFSIGKVVAEDPLLVQLDSATKVSEDQFALQTEMSKKIQTLHGYNLLMQLTKGRDKTLEISPDLFEEYKQSCSAQKPNTEKEDQPKMTVLSGVGSTRNLFNIAK